MKKNKINRVAHDVLGMVLVPGDLIAISGSGIKLGVYVQPSSAYGIQYLLFIAQVAEKCLTIRPLKSRVSGYYAQNKVIRIHENSLDREMLSLYKTMQTVAIDYAGSYYNYVQDYSKTPIYSSITQTNAKREAQEEILRANYARTNEARRSAVHNSLLGSNDTNDEDAW